MTMQPIDSIISQVQGLRAEIRWSQQKTLIELFASSFAIIFWISGSFFEKGFFGPRIVGFMLLYPLLINASMWALWALSGAVARLRSKDLYYGVGEDDTRAVYVEYDALRYTLHRTRVIERYIDLLTAMQFILMACVLGFTLVRVS